MFVAACPIPFDAAAAVLELGASPQAPGELTTGGTEQQFSDFLNKLLCPDEAEAPEHAGSEDEAPGGPPVPVFVSVQQVLPTGTRALLNYDLPVPEPVAAEPHCSVEIDPDKEKLPIPAEPAATPAALVLAEAPGEPFAPAASPDAEPAVPASDRISAPAPTPRKDAGAAKPIGETAFEIRLKPEDAGRKPAPPEIEPAQRTKPQPQPAEVVLRTATSYRPAPQPTPAPLQALARDKRSEVWASAHEPPAAEVPQLEQPAAARADAPARAPEPLVPPAPPTQRAVSIRLTGEGHEAVQVRIGEHAGGVRVDVRTPDAQLASRLRHDVGDLARRIELTGYAAAAVLPDRREVAAQAPGPADDSSDFSRDGGRQEKGSGEHRRNHEQRRELDTAEKDTYSFRSALNGIFS